MAASAHSHSSASHMFSTSMNSSSVLPQPSTSIGSGGSGGSGGGGAVVEQSMFAPSMMISNPISPSGGASTLVNSMVNSSNGPVESSSLGNSLNLQQQLLQNQHTQQQQQPQSASILSSTIIPRDALSQVLKVIYN